MKSKNELTQIVIDASFEKDGKRKLSCSAAFGLAKKHHIRVEDIGIICNENGIKIINCQLGCFGE